MCIHSANYSHSASLPFAPTSISADPWTHHEVCPQSFRNENKRPRVSLTCHIKMHLLTRTVIAKNNAVPEPHPHKPIPPSASAHNALHTIHSHSQRIQLDKGWSNDAQSRCRITGGGSKRGVVTGIRTTWLKNNKATQAGNTWSKGLVADTSLDGRHPYGSTCCRPSRHGLLVQLLV